ncbi:MAG: NuoI/complex I 23 kDa subunit family protein [Nitriliruptoraceae bacterium]
MSGTTIPGTGLLKGLAVTMKNLVRGPATQMYPHERPTLAPRTRGVIALMDENCTVCMLCSRECPDWCIYIDSHKETVPAAKEGGRTRTRNVLDRFAIDFSLCMYCGICVEVCPFDALWWSPEFEYSEYRIDDLLHEMGRLREWADTVPPPPMLDEGADAPAEVADAVAKADAALRAASRPAVPAGAAGPGERAGAPKAAAAGSAPAAAPKAAEVEVEAGEIDQATYDQLIAEGKSERIARAKAKAAWVRKEKARLAAAAPAAPAAEAPAAAPAPVVEEAAEAATEAPAAAPATAPADGPARLADVHVESSGEIDQETYDRLIAEGKGERIARAKAKAAWVRQQKQRMLEEGGA